MLLYIINKADAPNAAQRSVTLPQRPNVRAAIAI
jgi:hypothetical protein